MGYWYFIGGAGFTPPDISDLELWLDASDATSFNGGSISDNDAVSAWNDLSGNGNNTAQSNAAWRPTYKTNIINGQPAVLFTTGSPSDGMDMGTTALISTSAPFTMIAIAQQIATVPAFGTLVHWRHGVNDNMPWASSTDLNYRYFWWGGAAGTWGNHRQEVTDLGTSWHTVITTYNGSGATTGSNYTYLLDNTSKAITASSGIGANGGVGCVGAYMASGTPASGWNGYIAEIILYNKVLTAGELAQIAAYVSNKYGI